MEDAFDILIIGGGVHGVTVANYASQNDFKTILLEKNDYASATSSRSSKMLHGGLRYLELFDFEQVFEGIKAREELFETCPNLTKPREFLIPIPRGSYWLKFKLGVGLYLYDFFVRKKNRKHTYIKRKDLNFEGFDSSRNDLDGCYKYIDGEFNDSLFVMENIAKAKKQGAITKNYTEVLSIIKEDDISIVKAKCSITGTLNEYKAKVIINTTGPWVPFIENKDTEVINRGLKYSQGSHVLFNKKWDGPSLFLPMKGKARYYFVWPFLNKTMVGTTEREVEALEDDPLPYKDEIEEVYKRLEKDLPSSGLNKDSAFYCFAGIRALPTKQSIKNTSKLSRKHIWKIKDNVISLYGGKFTTSLWTAFEGLKIANKLLGSKKLNRDSSLSMTLNNNMSLEEKIKACVEKFDAKNLEDITRRRLFFEYEENNGIDKIDNVLDILSKYTKIDIKSEKSQYINRINKIKGLLK